MTAAIGLGAYSERYYKATGKTEHEIRFYITSLKSDAALLNRVIRNHCGIGKTALGARCGLRRRPRPQTRGDATENFSVLRRIAPNLLKQDKSSPRGIKGKRLKAAWNNNYLLQLLKI